MKIICAFLLASVFTATSALYQINVGTSPNDRTGDPIRQAFIKVNANSISLDASIAAANSTNAKHFTALTGLTNRAVLAEATNAANTAGVSAAGVTNAAQQAAMVGLTNIAAGKQSGSFALSNLLAQGFTNIIAGSNTEIHVTGGSLVVSAVPAIVTNGLPVMQVTNLLAQNIDTDTFNAGTLIATNTVYLTRTNAGSAGNYVADFARAEEMITVGGNVTFLHGTNLQAGATNTCISLTLMNFSGSDRTLTIPAAWKESLNFPTVLTNATILKLTLHNYGGLSQTNILAGATQF